MVVRNKLAILTLVLFSLSIIQTGCATIRKKTQKKDVKTGMFDNNREELERRFGKIVQGQTRTADLSTLGFELGAKNVQVFSGVPAFRELFGQEAFRNMIGNDFNKHLPEYNRYTLYQIPFQDTLVTSDRIYLNKKTTTTVGWDIVYSIVIHDDLVVYAAPRAVFYNQSQKDVAFLSGLIAILQEIGGSVGGIIR